MLRTNAYSILCVFVRVFALYLFATTLIGLPGDYAAAVRSTHGDTFLPAVMAGSAFEAVASALLWIFADKLARLALARPQQVVFESDMPASEWQALAFSILGAWELFEGFFYASFRAVRVGMVAYGAPSGQAHAFLTDEFYAWLAADGLRMVIGAALLFGARGLAGIVTRYRTIGTHPVPQSGNGPGDGSA